MICECVVCIHDDSAVRPPGSQPQEMPHPGVEHGYCCCHVALYWPSHPLHTGWRGLSRCRGRILLQNGAPGELTKSPAACCMTPTAGLASRLQYAYLWLKLYADLQHTIRQLCIPMGPRLPGWVHSFQHEAIAMQLSRETRGMAQEAFAKHHAGFHADSLRVASLMADMYAAGIWPTTTMQDRLMIQAAHAVIPACNSICTSLCLAEAWHPD